MATPESQGPGRSRMDVPERSTASMLVWNHTRLWLAVLSAIATFLVLPAQWSGISRLLIAWNVAIAVFVPLAAWWMSRLDARGLRARYEEEDPTGPVILLVIVVAALLSLVAIVALTAGLKQAGPTVRLGHIVLASATIMESWLVVPMMFTLHYADMYYSEPPESAPLSFPRTSEPMFWDFMYFSFTIAAACQTADVATHSAPIRRLVVAHSIVSFLFNVSILGFAVNVTAGLLGGS